MNREYHLFLKDIVESILSIEKFMEGLSFQEFAKDDKTSAAVVHKIEIIGEASKNIPLNIRKKYNDIPWNDMAKMRDKVTHAYFVVDYEIVWKTVRERFPEIRERIGKAIEEERLK